MRATEVLQKCLRDALGSMHALRGRVLLKHKKRGQSLRFPHESLRSINILRTD